VLYLLAVVVEEVKRVVDAIGVFGPTPRSISPGKIN